MLMPELMCEAARRYGQGCGLSAVLDDAANQSRHCMDAPDEVQDGVEWYVDDDFPDICGAVPRFIDLR